MKILIVAVLIIFNGCNPKLSNLKIPSNDSTHSIIYFDIDKNDSYLGVLKLKTKKQKERLITKDKKLISEVLNFIRKNEDNWVKLPNGNTYKPKKLYAFIDNNDNPSMIIWVEKDEITILTKPIDPRNIHWSYRLDKASLLFFKKILLQKNS